MTTERMKHDGREDNKAQQWRQQRGQIAIIEKSCDDDRDNAE